MSDFVHKESPAGAACGALYIRTETIPQRGGIKDIAPGFSPGDVISGKGLRLTAAYSSSTSSVIYTAELWGFI